MEPLATVILIHGYTGSPDKPAFHWLRRELDAENVRLAVPAMPMPDHPVEQDWLDTIDAEVARAESPIILVGHSLGALAVLRWLEARAKQPVHAMISLAGVTLPHKHSKATFATEWSDLSNWDQIRSNARHFAIIHSDDDTHVAMDESDLLVEKVGASLMKVTARGHFMVSEGVIDLPELLQVIDTLIQLAK